MRWDIPSEVSNAIQPDGKSAAWAFRHDFIIREIDAGWRPVIHLGFLNDIETDDSTSSAIRLRRGPRSQYSLWKEAGARGANARDDALGDAEVTTHRGYVVDWIDASGDAHQGGAVVSTLRREYERLHLVATMPARRHPLRSYIVALFKRGELVSVREAELICDASRQAITKWLRREHIDIGVRRLDRIGRLRAKAMTDLDDMPVKRLSKAELRKQTEKAISEFNRRNRSQ